jgi:SAM-dependent methyltransferase
MSDDPRLYGARWAGIYDEWHAGMMDDEGAVAAVADLAGDGAVLELAVGTGRLALPLARRGIPVTGVDISEEMLAELAAKPDADKVTTVVGDMTTVRVPGEFSVVLVAFSSVFVLTTLDDQVELFRNAAAHLRPGGRFVLETMFARGDGSSALRVDRVEADQVVLVANTTDPVTSVHTGSWMVIGPGGTTLYPISGRRTTHHELDLMARLAGLELENRWGDWHRGPFTAESRLHVSVYRKP